MVIQKNQATQIIKEYCSRSLYGFVKTMWNQIEVNPYCDNWHIQTICDALQKRYNIYAGDHKNRDTTNRYDQLFNLPPGSSKTLIINVFFPAWIWLRNPAVKTINSGYSYTIAEETSSKFLKLITSDLYTSLIDYKVVKSSLNNIKNNKGGQRFTTSTTGTITGVHADIIINDDPNSPKSIYSEPARNEAKVFVNEILPSRKTNLKRSYTITVQQRLHNDDVSGEILLQNKKLEHIVIPAINEQGESFFPDRFPLEFLLEQKEILGSVSFNAQYLQRTQEASGGIIKKDWLIEEELKPNTNLMYFIDSAYGGKDADDNAILGCYVENNNLYLHSLEINKLEFPELIKWLKIHIPNNSKVYIEGKASGKSIIQTLKRGSNFNLIELQVKDSKIVRKHGVSPFFEAGRIIINKRIRYKQELIEQLIFDNTKNDDALDVTMHAIETLLKKATGKYSIK